MLKRFFLLPLLSFFFPSCIAQDRKSPEEFSGDRETIYQFTVKDIEGEDFDLSTLKGKKVMIVNTASKCGLTPQYEKLQNLYEKYKDKGFVIIGFPANNFLWQEPGTDDEIADFCEKNYGVTFPMMSKISVKGSDQHPLYQFLTSKKRNGISGTKIKWNFQKYLIDEQGYVVRMLKPKEKPDSEEVIEWIEGKMDFN